jgi:phage host-nuclease inhibitor protein Gam
LRRQPVWRYEAFIKIKKPARDAMEIVETVKDAIKKIIDLSDLERQEIEAYVEFR